MKLGIKETYEVRKYVEKELILNEKVVIFLYNLISKLILKEDRKFVVRTGYNTSKPITKEWIAQQLAANRIEDKVIVETDEDPEYEDTPFVVNHANPYDHRWPGDYDEDAYEDWWVEEYSLLDFLMNTYDGPHGEPFFVKYPGRFDFKETSVKYGRDELVSKDYQIAEASDYTRLGIKPPTYRNSADD